MVVPTHGAAPGPAEGTVLGRLSPRSGMAVTFTSGWENKHFVEPILSGIRYALPAFFTTRPKEEAAAQHPFDDDAAVAEALWRAALWPQTQEDADMLRLRWHELLA